MVRFVFSISLDPNIENEHKEHAEKRQQVACEAFGEGKVPKLETATYTVLGSLAFCLSVSQCV